MIRRTPRSTRTDTLFPYTTLFRSVQFTGAGLGAAGIVSDLDRRDQIPATCHRVHYVAASRLHVKYVEYDPHRRAGYCLRDGIGVGNIGDQQHRIIAIIDRLNADYDTRAFGKRCHTLEV